MRGKDNSGVNKMRKLMGVLIFFKYPSMIASKMPINIISIFFRISCFFGVI